MTDDVRKEKFISQFIEENDCLDEFYMDRHVLKWFWQFLETEGVI